MSVKAARPRLRVRNLFVGWWLLGAAVAVQVLPASFLMHSYSAYAVVMQLEFGWSITVFATAFAAQQLVFGLLGPFQGWLLLRFGPQRMIRVGLVIFALGLALLSQVRDLPLFYIALLIASCGGSLAGFLSLNTAVVNWFIRHRSLALAMIQIGISAGGLIAPAIAWSLTTQGWRFTALVSAVLALLVGLPLAMLIREPTRVFTRDEIIDRVFGYDFDGFDRTVDAHVSNLRRKLRDDGDAASCIATVYGVGYRFDSD